MNKRDDSGFILVTLLTLMVPMVIVVAAVTGAMAGKGNELLVELDREVALLAAESGLDHALHGARTGALADGTIYNHEIGSDQSFMVTVTALATDGADNDNDGQIDEANEDGFRIVVTGKYRTAMRQLVGFIGPVPRLPAIHDAVERSTFDLAPLASRLGQSADIVLTSDDYTAADLGHADTRTTHISYRDGDVRFSGETRGAGILVVTGDLEVEGTFRFDGVIIVLGKISSTAKQAVVRGSILLGQEAGRTELGDTFDVQHSQEAVHLANSMSGEYVALNGWQELSN